MILLLTQFMTSVNMFLMGLWSLTQLDVYLANYGAFLSVTDDKAEYFWGPSYVCNVTGIFSVKSNPY